MSEHRRRGRAARLSGWRGRRLVAGAGAVVLVAALSASTAQAVPSSFVELDGNVVSNGTGTFDWANSGALTTTGGTYSRAGSGGLFDGGHFNGNTTPPTAPTRTAASLADASIADAKFKIDPLSVDVTSCGTGDPTVYTGSGGETNGDLLSTDTFGTGSVPNKDDLSNVYAAAHVTGTTNEVFFGAERVINNGDSHIDFEFLQGTVTIPNACAGSFSGNRTQGDFLLSVDFTNGGTLGGTILYRWICDATFNAAHNGQVCNPTKKSPAHYEITGNTAVQINVNPGATAIGCGGWVCRNPDGSPTTTIAQNELMEGGIDLAQLGFTGCVSTFLPHTRSSQSFTATLKDFEIIPFNTCKSPTISTQVKKASDNSNVANGASVPIGTAVYDTATLTGATADAGGTVNYKLFSDATCSTLSTTPALNQTVNVTNGVVPNSNNVTFNSAGTWYFQATYSGDARNNVPAGGAKSGCDTEIIVISPNTPAITTQVKKASNDSNVPNGGSVPIGTAVYDTSTLSGATANAGGTVTYKLFSDAGCSTLSTTPALNQTVNVTNGVVPNSNNVTFNSAGTWYFQATYSGDSNNSGPVSSACNSEVVVVSPNAPVPHSTPVTQIKDTFSVTGLTSDATGNVVVGLYSDATCTGANQIGSNATFAASGNVGGTLTGETSFQVVTSGTYYYKISYAGDNNNTGFSDCGSESVAVTITSLP